MKEENQKTKKEGFYDWPPEDRGRITDLFSLLIKIDERISIKNENKIKTN